MYNNLLTLAEKPQDNPVSEEELDRYGSYLITLIDHDYPGRTAALWNVAHRAFKIDAGMSMMVGNPAYLGDILKAFRSDSKYAGGGLGAGFKEAAIPHLDEVTSLAKAMGAVNIIKKTPDGKLVGDNTDGAGYARSLEKLFAEQHESMKGKNILLLGAGGSGRAIAFALADKGAHLTILNRTEKKAEELADALNVHFGTGTATGGGRLLLPTLLPKQDAVVSVVDDAQSPLDEYSTLGDMALPVSTDSVKKNQQQASELLRTAKPSLIVSDIRIRKEETPMLALAREHKLRVLNGIPMVVNQGVAAFWWIYQSVLSERDIELVDVEDVMWGVSKL